MEKEKSFLSRVWYGFADHYGGGAFLILSILYLVFLTNVVGLPAWLAGTIPLVALIPLLLLAGVIHELFVSGPLVVMYASES